MSERSNRAGDPGVAGPTVEPLLVVSGLRVHLRTERGRVKAIDGTDFDLKRGEALALVGESGSGKTMTALALMRLLPVNAEVLGGEVLLNGVDLLKLSEEEMRRVRGGGIGMTFQDPSTFLNPVMKVGEQVAEVIRVHDRTAGPRRVVEMLDMVRLPSPARAADLYPHELSGGMRQRVLLAISLAARPNLLIADEPTTALDVTIQAQVLDLIRSLQQELGLSMILISHDLGVVAEICTRACIMYAGRMMETAPIDDLFENPCHPYTRGLLGSTLSVHERRLILAAMAGAAPDLISPPPGCRFHPRCPEAMDRCRVEEPPIAPVGPSGATRARCWLYHHGG